MALEGNVKEKPGTGAMTTQDGTQVISGGGGGGTGAMTTQDGTQVISGGGGGGASTTVKAAPAAGKPAPQKPQTATPTPVDGTPPPAAAAKPTSLLEAGDEGDDEGVSEPSTPADWPEDWRDKAVADIADEKVRAKELKRLSRFKSPADVYKSWRAMEQKLSDDYEPKYSEDWDDEKKAEYRKEKGIPDKADDYTLPEVEGMQWTEADHAPLKSFLDAAHKAALPQNVVDGMLTWYKQHEAKLEEQAYEADESDRSTREEDLRSEWGPEFKQHRARVRQLLTETDPERIPAPEGLLEMIDGARYNGHRLINMPGMMEWLSQLALNTYGNNAMTKGQAATLSSRKTEIERIMDSNFAEYKAKGLDKEYAEILEREARAR